MDVKSLYKSVLYPSAPFSTRDDNNAIQSLIDLSSKEIVTDASLTRAAVDVLPISYPFLNNEYIYVTIASKRNVTLIL